MEFNFISLSLFQNFIFICWEVVLSKKNDVDTNTLYNLVLIAHLTFALYFTLMSMWRPLPHLVKALRIHTTCPCDNLTVTYYFLLNKRHCDILFHHAKPAWQPFPKELWYSPPPPFPLKALWHPSPLLPRFIPHDYPWGTSLPPEPCDIPTPIPRKILTTSSQNHHNSSPPSS